MTTSTKSYTAKSSAIRAAKKAHAAEYDAGLVTIAQDDSEKWVFIVAAATPAAREYSPAAEELHDAINAKKATKEEKATILTGVDNQPSDIVLQKAIAKKKASNKKVAKPTVDTTEAEQLGIDGLDNLAKLAKEGLVSRVSETAKPCNRVWEIADAMVDCRRKDVIAACVDQGVAYYTARTQYQHWFTAQKNDKAAAERAAAKKAAK